MLEDQGLRARTQQGIIEGFAEEGVKKFFGIPFALPPVGDLRWKHARPPAAWDGVRPAKEFSAAPFQTIAVPIPLRSNGISEDCLYLNVWTKTTSPDAKQPVLVWFFGGGNLRGAASIAHNDGSQLAKLGLTVVTPNYRVGAFGFLNDERMGCNFAVGDNVAALRWVKENIASFGGDPSRVLIAGNSAGAVSVRTLLQTPQAKGLYQRAFIQSAGFDAPANGMGWSFERSRQATQDLWKSLNTSDPDELRKLPAEVVGAAAHPLSGIFPKEGHVHTPLNLVWMPAPDGDLVLETEAGWSDGAPLMVGCTENEARWSLSPTAGYTSDLLTNMVKQLAGDKADDVLAILNKSGGTIFDKLDRLYTTVVWSEPAFAAMKRFDAAGKDLFYVHFARSGPEAVVTNRLAAHGAPVPYFFANMADDGTYDDVDKQLSEEMTSALVEFARNGVPVSTGGIAWPKFTVALPRETLVVDTISAASYKITPLLRTINGLRPAEGGSKSIASNTVPHAVSETPARRGLLGDRTDRGEITEAADGVPIWYERFGNGEPAWVFIHGGMCDASYWNEQIEALASNCAVIVLDLPGHGRSGSHRKSWSVAAFADDVRRVVRACGAKELIVVGHSMGGVVALEAVRLLGPTAKGVVVVDFLHDVGGKAPQQRPNAPSGQQRQESADAARLRMAAALRRGMFTAHPSELQETIVQSLVSFSPEIGAALRQAVGAYDLSAGIKAISSIPLAIVQSSLRNTDVASIRQLHPNSRITRFADAGHFMMLEKPRQFNAVLENEGLVMRGVTEAL